MANEIYKKEQKLIEALKAVPSCIIAFSGGLDSTYLCMMAKSHVSGRVVAVTVIDASVPESDIRSTQKFSAGQNIEHIIIKTDIDEKVRQNHEDRCYHCKFLLFEKLASMKTEEGLRTVMDGENASDATDNRPGSRAAREWNVSSPLADAELSKSEIRLLAKKIGLETWDRPQSACLSSRVPTGTPINDETLRKIDLTESFIQSKGIKMIRARVEGSGTRLELGQEENTSQNRELLKGLEAEIIKLGWESMSVDPTGYVPSGLRRKKHEK